MASFSKPASSLAKSYGGRSLRPAVSALLICSIVAGSAWGLASAFSAIDEAGRIVSEGPVGLRLAVVEVHRNEIVPFAVKSARFRKASESELRAGELTTEAILTAHRRRVATEIAAAERRKNAEEARLLVQAQLAARAIDREEWTSGKAVITTALVEDVPVREIQPFALVLANPAGEDADDGDDADLALPSEVPLPESRPPVERAVPGRKPDDAGPTLRRAPAEPKADIAYAKPKRTLFGSLFGRNGGDAWPGSRTKVAIYDVSAATVYLPDGTRLRAHSGIGPMRDNPRYEHVTMRGPTPAGIYRLSMREQRFYGVEAIRMTSIDGRNPKNRTGLLTHTNLLRGQIGSHGCVAFQNYEPFLRAFKRGDISIMVVVPALPSSPTQLAELYRRAGA